MSDTGTTTTPALPLDKVEGLIKRLFEKQEEAAKARHAAVMQAVELMTNSFGDLCDAVEKLQQATDKLAGEVRGDAPDEEGNSFNDDIKAITGSLERIEEAVTKVPDRVVAELEQIAPADPANASTVQ